MFVYRNLTPETDLTGWTSETPIGSEGYVFYIATEGEDQLVLFRMDANYTNAGGIEDYILDSINFDDIRNHTSKS
jgi:hypothetical protein